MIRRYELPGWTDEQVLAIPYERFVQMLRVIHQERLQEVTWGAFLQGAGGKDPFGKFLRRFGLEARTPPDDDTAERARERTVQVVRGKLGRLYRPPMKA